jgi:hypothetical protein
MGKGISQGVRSSGQRVDVAEAKPGGRKVNVDSQRIKLLSHQAQVLLQQLAVVEKEYVELSMREKALQRMISYANACYIALFACLPEYPPACQPALCPSKAAQGLMNSIVPHPTSQLQAHENLGIDTTAADLAGAQELNALDMAAAHAAYISRASVLVVRIGTPAAMPGDLPELEDLTRRHWANIIKTGVRSIHTLWRCTPLNFETGEVEEEPDELWSHVLCKVGLCQEQLLTLAAGEGLLPENVCAAGLLMAVTGL